MSNQSKPFSEIRRELKRKPSAAAAPVPAAEQSQLPLACKIVRELYGPEPEGNADCWWSMVHRTEKILVSRAASAPQEAAETAAWAQLRRIAVALGWQNIWQEPKGDRFFVERPAEEKGMITVNTLDREIDLLIAARDTPTDDPSTLER